MSYDIMLVALIAFGMGIAIGINMSIRPIPSMTYEAIYKTIEIIAKALEEIKSEKDIKIVQEKINKLIKDLNTAKGMFK